MVNVDAQPEELAMFGQGRQGMMGVPTPKSTSSKDNINGGCPFDVIVITSPDAEAARAVQELISTTCCQLFSSASDGSSEPVDPSSLPSANGGEDESSGIFQSANGTIFISSYDPYGCRMGSGGGTIAALAEADKVYCERHNQSNNGTKPTVLICHAGGESSRCPTQIVLGKAWTSLPLLSQDDNSATSASSSAIVSNPTSLLIASLSKVFVDVPQGSVVVAASDVLLSFVSSDGEEDQQYQQQKINFDEIVDAQTKGHVIGLAVPALVETAQNHGVFVPDFAVSKSSDHRGWRVQPTKEVLQKPKPNELTDDRSFHKQGEKEDGNKLCAWIDTGVIAFLPEAAETLRELLQSTLRCCTKDGLMDMYNEQHGADAGQANGSKRQKLDPSVEKLTTAPSDVEAFAKRNAPKICLYGDMLHALRTTLGEKKAGSSSDGTLLGSLYKKLSQHDLYTCTIPTGSFVHLGTTGELVSFLADLPRDMNGQDHRNNNSVFQKSMGVTPRADSFVSGFDPKETKDAIVLNSVLVANDVDTLLLEPSYIGGGSVVEHCHIDCSGSITIGARCLLSGIRGPLKSSSLTVPGGICLQLLPLRQIEEGSSMPEDGTESFVCIFHGVDDPIKDKSTSKKLFGKNMKAVLEESGFAEGDIWDSSIPCEQRMLWNARINPVLTISRDKKEFDFTFLNWLYWLNIALTGDGRNRGMLAPNTHHRAGLNQWRDARRLSLSEIRCSADSVAEAKYRGSIPSKRVWDECQDTILDILTNRKHQPIDVGHVSDLITASYSVDGAHLCVNALKETLNAIDGIALSAFSQGRFDVVGRSLMTMSSIISDVCGSLQNSRNQFSDAASDTLASSSATLDTIIARLQSEDASILNSLISRRNELILSDEGSFNPCLAKECCHYLERAAGAMTEKCIGGTTTNSRPTYTLTSPLPIGTTVVASAPARIDLAGGWSDTPPISYELGGAVACLAVLVDDKRPLRAKCRVKGGDTGIVLRIESKTLKEEELVDSTTVTINNLGDLSDFRDPTGKCTLLKCALILLGLVSKETILENDASTSIQPYLQKFCKTNHDSIRLEVTSTSLLPTGSGMGSSSILGGCIIAAIAKCIGVRLTGMDGSSSKEVEINDSSSLIHAVMMLEQLLTTGGGWQDNIGGLVGGLKLGSSDAHVLPLQTGVHRHDLAPDVVKELNQRMVLAFSGKPRLAKNILQKVLQRWARRNKDIIDTVNGLKSGSSDAIDSLTNGDFDGLGKCMTRYWKQKIVMAGEESGVEPESVRSLLDLLTAKGEVVGATLCGAGGGGFLAILASKGSNQEGLESFVKNAMCNGESANASDFRHFSFHSCTYSDDGLIVEIQEE